MKTILVPTDFSENANHALDYAINLAKHLKARLILLHTYLVPYDFEIQLPKIIEELETKSKEGLKKTLENVQEKTNALGIKCESFSTVGEPVETILEFSDQEKVDLIVMGTQGASGLKRALIGSNTASLINRASCPVMAVPAKCPINNISSLLFSTDYRQDDVKTIQRLVEFAEKLDAGISILHVSESQSFSEELRFRGFRDLIREKVGYKKLEFYVDVAGTVYEGIDSFIKARKPSMVVTGTYRRSFFGSILEPSITKKMAYYTEVPLLSVNVDH